MPNRRKWEGQWKLCGRQAHKRGLEVTAEGMMLEKRSEDNNIRVVPSIGVCNRNP